MDDIADERQSMTETTTTIKDGHCTLGKAYLNNKQYTEAIKHFQKCSHIDAHCGVCRAHLAQNDDESAETAVLGARRSASNAPEVLSLPDVLKDTYYHKGLTDYNAERYREAVDGFEKAIAFKATYIAAYHAQVLSYFGLHNDIILMQAKMCG